MREVVVYLMGFVVGFCVCFLVFALPSLVSTTDERDLN